MRRPSVLVLVALLFFSMFTFLHFTSEGLEVSPYDGTSVVSTIGTTDELCCTRSVIEVGGYYFCFYIRTGDYHLVCRSSSDGVNWNPEQDASDSSLEQSFANGVFTDGTNILIGFYNGTDSLTNMTACSFYVRNGTQSDGIITWSPAIEICQGGGYASRGFSFCKTSAGYYWVSFSYIYTAGTPWYCISVYNSSDLSSWSLSLDSTSSVLVTPGYRPETQITCDPRHSNGVMLASDPYGPNAFGYTVFDNDEWSTPAAFAAKTADDYAFSGWSLTTGNNEIQFVCEPATWSQTGDALGGPLTSYVYTNSWSGGLTVDSSICWGPSLTSYNDTSLYLLYYNDSLSTVYCRALTYSTMTWSEPMALATGETLARGLPVLSEQNPPAANTGVVWGGGTEGSLDLRFTWFSLNSTSPVGPPSYYLPFPSYNTTSAGATCMFSCEWTNLTSDPVSAAYYSDNVSGTWSFNNSATLAAANGFSCWANFTVTLPPVGSVVLYYWTCVDSGGNWNTAMPNQTLTVMRPLSLFALGTIASANEWGELSRLFDRCLVFWRNPPGDSYNVLTAFNLSTNAFSDVWTNPSHLRIAALVVANDTLYFGLGTDGYDWSTIMYTTDLVNFYQLGNVTVNLESVCVYTGPGIYHNCLYFGGAVSGTAAAIDRWYNGQDQRAWTGGVTTSDDCTWLTMYNSTMMIGCDVPVNIIYTNDGGNFTDEHLSDTYDPLPYFLVWSDEEIMSSGTVYMAIEGGMYQGPDYGGMATWTGPGTQFETVWNPCGLYGVSNTFVGGTNNLMDQTTHSFTGNPVIYSYNSTGGMADVFWTNTTAVGAVFSVFYDASIGSWYGMYWDQNSDETTVFTIVPTPLQSISSSGGSRMPYLD